MAKPYVDVGFGNVVVTGDVVSIVSYRSIPVRRLVAEQEKRQYVVDATRGKLVRTVVVLRSNQLVLSCLPLDTVKSSYKEALNGHR